MKSPPPAQLRPVQYLLWLWRPAAAAVWSSCVGGAVAVQLRWFAVVKLQPSVVRGRGRVSSGGDG